MIDDQNLTRRGRPKTVNRDHLIEVAMESYWRDGPTYVSVNEICKRAQVSKPGLYREFGGEDGLRQVVLQTYRENALELMYDIFRSDRSFPESIDALCAFLRVYQARFDQPRGCLLQDMRSARDKLGEATIKAIVIYRQESLMVYTDWISRAKARGEVSTSLSDTAAANYIDLQMAGAMTLIKRRAPADSVDEFFRTAFSVFSLDRCGF